MTDKKAHPSRKVISLLIFGLVLHTLVIPQLGGARKALHSIGASNPVWLGAAVVLELASLMAYARMTQLLLHGAHRPPLSITFGTTMASTGINHVLPGGAATTAAVNYRLLGRVGVKPDELGFALGTEAIGSAAVLNVMLWTALLISIPVSGFHPVYGVAAAFGAALMVVAGVGIVSILRGSETFADRLASLLGRLPKLDAIGVRDAILRASVQLRAFVSDTPRLRMVTGLAATNWILDAAALWAAVAAFGSYANVVGLAVAYGLANVMAAIPVSPGGLGVVEAVLIPTLVGFGVPLTVASVGVVAYRIVAFWLPIPLGAIAYVLVDQLAEQASPVSTAS